MKPSFPVIANAVTLFFVSFCSQQVKAEIPFSDGDRILFMGDSITQDGRYIAMVEAYLWAAHPELHLDIINGGLGSETVSGITEPVHPFPRPNVNERLGRALSLVKPDWVVVCYGMNDGIYHPVDPKRTNAYRDGLTKVIDTVRASGAKLILLTPPSFDVDAAPVQSRLKEAKDDEPYGYRKPYPKYDETLVEFSGVVSSFAEAGSVERVIDVHAATSKYLQRVKHSNPDYQYGDGIHPPVDGHLAIARSVLVGLGCDEGKVNSWLGMLTGIKAPVGEPVKPTERQSAFQELLFSRFTKRSASYRKAIGFVTPVKIDAPSIKFANREAWTQEQKLRDMIVELTDGESMISPLAAKATKKWESEIQKLDELDDKETHSEEAVLFIGSSSIRLWEDIAQDMSPYETIRRGYGGAKFSDLVVFAKRLITPHRYRAVVIFVGNDVTGKEDDPSPEEVQRMARYVCDVSQAHQPDAPVFLVEITPTPLRFANWSNICDVNAALREMSLTKPGVNFVTTADHYLDDNKEPKQEYFKEDRLHQNKNGYQLWSSLLKQKMNDVLQKQ